MRKGDQTRREIIRNQRHSLIKEDAADILRIENGVLAEHWDVLRDEATEEQSKSKAPMFGSSFPK